MQSTNHTTQKAQEIISAQHARALLREKSRTKRRQLREKRANAARFVKANGKDVGSAAYIASEKGFTKKMKLPAHFNVLINNTRRFIFAKKSYLNSKGYQCALYSCGHQRLFRILVVLLTHCDLLSGQIGKPTRLHMDTTGHDAYMLQYARRFGESISSSTWYRYIDILKLIGVFSSEEIKIKLSEQGAADLVIHSEASYKWLSKAFLTQIGAFTDLVLNSIKSAYKKAIDKGLSFVWVVHHSPKALKTNEKDFFSNPSPSPNAYN